MLVVCGSDFSPGADRAAHVAARIALAGKGRLLLVAVEPAAAAHGVVRGVLERDADVLRKLGVDVVTLEKRGGEPGAQLAQVARERCADLIVVGAAGQAAHGGLGRVPERLVAACDRPVLVVREDRSIDEWLDGARALRLLYASSLQDRHAGAKATLHALARFGRCDVVAVHVPPHDVEGDVAPRDIDVDALARAQSDDPSTHHLRVASLREQVGPIAGEPIECRIAPASASIDDAILDVADACKSDLIVVGAHERHGVFLPWHGSVSASITRHARGNVLVAKGAQPWSRG